MYKPRTILQLDVPDWDGNAFIHWHPPVISFKWTKNHHLAADELVVTVPWMEAGVDPRQIKNARGAFWLWDDASQKFDEDTHLRFTGICKKAQRKLGSDGWEVELQFQDYTSLFLNMRPFPSDGIPEWTDTVPQAWQKICDNVGYRNRETGKIKSSVEALRYAMVVRPPEIASRTMGDSVSQRFHAISKPTPKPRSDAWAVWQWLCASIGLVSYIDRNELIVTTTNEHYVEENAPRLMYGHNILTFEETADVHVSQKGILGKAFDPLTGRLLESAFPPPDDPRIKKSRAVVKRAAKDGRDVSLNEASAEYEEFNFPEITTQDGLDARVREAFEEFSKQELKGKIGTAEMFLYGRDGSRIEVAELRAGDCIYLGMDERVRDLKKFSMSESERIEYIMRTCGYIREVAELVSRNIHNRALAEPTFHIETIEVEYSLGKFNVDITYHNKVYLTGLYL